MRGTSAVGDPGEGPAPPLFPPLFLDQTEARGADKINLRPPFPPPYLKVWIGHWSVTRLLHRIESQTTARGVEV